MKGDFTRNTFERTHHYSSVRMQQGRVQLDADWNEQRDIDAHHEQAVIHDVIGLCGAPLHTVGFAIQPHNGDLSISAGHYYVGGLLCENDADVLFTQQPDLPGAELPSTTIPASIGLYFAYLDVWQRHLTALEDPSMREVALGGPDTSTRTKTVWQVRLVQVGDLGEALNCLSPSEAWQQETASSTGQLQARAQPSTTQPDLCLIPSGAGYRRLENQLYRVEIHQGGPLGMATYTWSRDNGTVVTPWLDKSGNDLTVGSLGRDHVLSFANGQWVELTDDTRELRGQRGTLVSLDNAEGQILRIAPLTATGSVDRADFPNNPKVRRWDMPNGAITVEVPSSNDGWIPLEDGVEVKFEPGIYKTGDYWLIPARTLTGDVEWPRDTTNTPQLQLPHGIHHHYCRLALLSLDSTGWSVLSDCRQLFPPVTELTSLFYISGTGQEATPDPIQPAQLLLLAQPLQVGVAQGSHGVPHATVRFTVTEGNGRLPGNAITVPIITDADGIASCTWSLDSTTLSQQVEARLLDAAGNPVHIPIRFTANLSLASQVAYDPSDCPVLALAGAHTVQAAIDQLCQQLPDAEPGIAIQRILSQEDSAPVLNDLLLPVTRLASGLRIECDAPLSPESGGSVATTPPSKYPDAIPAKPTCFVTLDLPYPLGSEQNFWDFRQIIGFQPLILGSKVDIAGNVMTWEPTPATRGWLQQILFQRLNTQEATDRILAHLTVKGNFIWRESSSAEPALYLDGDIFGRLGPNDRVDLRLPSGNGRRGGDFEMWFWLTPAAITGQDLVITATVNPPVGNTILHSITGIVHDSAGDVVPGVRVTLTGPRDQQTAEPGPDDDGQFLFANLEPGDYIIAAQLGTLSAEVGVSIPRTTPVFHPEDFPGRTLDEITGVGPVFRTRMEEREITHPAQVASMEQERLAPILQNSASRARMIIEAARRLLSQ